MEKSSKSKDGTNQFCAIFHYDEIALKGKNRGFFENILLQNLKDKRETFGLKGTVKMVFGRGVIYFENKLTETESTKWREIMSTTFGIVNFSFGVNIIHDSEIQTFCKATEEFDFVSEGTFRVSTKRADKSFPATSEEINRQVGGAILRKYSDKKVKLKNPDENFFIEVLGSHAFLYLNKIKGPGGLPVCSSGTGSVLLSGGIDSPVSAFYAMKRGIRPIFVHFHSYPQTSKTSLNGVRELAQTLTKFHPKLELFMVPFLNIQKEILKKSPDKFRILLYRRFMVRIAEEISKRNKSKVLITGESVGQVASQTLENMAAVERVTLMPILRPLCCFDKKEIIEVARN
ncbi:MAG: tRNA 4-thiouridine(8) synthase ThiI, partial [Candidatus Peregrinibacteria bacterium]|nr:tRNA 4-thiouridine(8) synthase ThiI [Candidatus Peregrinibacteria bacterium]